MSDVRAAAEAIVVCVTKRAVNEHSTEYVRDTDKQGFGLLEPYEVAVAWLAEHDERPLTLDLVRKYAEVEHRRRWVLCGGWRHSAASS